MLALAALGYATPAAAVQPGSESIRRSRARVEEEHRAELEKLAGWCDERGLSAAAERTRKAARPRDPWKLYLVTLPTSGETAADTSTKTDDERQWRKQFAALGATQADALFKLAQQAIRGKQASLAYELVLEMLRANPEHPEGRKLLGFIKYKGAWHTPFEVDKLKRGFVWHEKFGWLPASYVARYEAGQRYYNGRWIGQDEEAEIRGDMRSAWAIETEHYTIRTNKSLEAGVQIGQRLERLYRAWQQTFAAYYASPDQLLRMFEGRTANRRGGSGPHHLVVYFRNRDEYDAALAGQVPPGVVTTGIYLGDMRTAYFYSGADDKDFTTLYHEASHQLFSETRDVTPDIGQRGNFWIVEGIACYMESFEEHDDYDTVGGGVECPRLNAAAVRLLRDNFYVPLAELTRFGINDLKHDPRIAMLYSQSAGLAHFLMHYQDGRYRDAALAYLSAIYSGDDDPATLADLTGKSYEELDGEYRDFLKSLPPE